MLEDEIPEFLSGMLGLKKKAAPRPTEELPDVRKFALQLLKKYHAMANMDALNWKIEFRDKQSGRHYEIAISMHEVKP